MTRTSASSSSFNPFDELPGTKYEFLVFLYIVRSDSLIAVLSKHAEQIGISDIQSLIDSKLPESEQVEFKESLSTTGQSADPWMEGNNKIGDQAKDALLKEAVGFANAYGGVVLLGIGESEAKPPVAARISPIPRCADLAERLKLVFRDRVEPELPRIDIFAVQTEGHAGVVIIRVAHSRLAPHRVTGTRVCPVRRSDRCEEMSMRQIQDMTLNVSRGLERLERRFAERAKRFPQEFGRLHTPMDAFGIRFTAVPVGDEIRLDTVFRQGRLAEEFKKPQFTIWRRKDGTDRELFGSERIHSLCPSSWQPRLRAARAEDGHPHDDDTLIRNSYRELHCDGLIELGLVSVRTVLNPLDKVPAPCTLAHCLPVVEFTHLALWTDHVRGQAHAPTAEYALEIEICVRGSAVSVDCDHYFSAGRFPPGGIEFPRYTLGDSDEIPRLSALFERDFWNSFGADIGSAQGEVIAKGL